MLSATQTPSQPARYAQFENLFVNTATVLNGPVQITSSAIYNTAPLNAPRNLQVGNDGNVGAAAGATGGTVTSITSDNTLASSPDPITTTGTLAVNPNFLGFFIPQWTGGSGTNTDPYTAADNTGGIQNALTTLQATTKGGKVMLGSNVYTLQGIIELPSNTYTNCGLEGTNAGTVSSAGVPTTGGTGLKVIGVLLASQIRINNSNTNPVPRSIQLKNFAIWGAGGISTSTDLTKNTGILFVGGAAQSVIRDVNFAGLTCGIQSATGAVLPVDNLRIEDCNFEAVSYGIFFNTTGSSRQKILLNNCMFKTIAHQGSYFSSVQKSKVTNCTFDSCNQTHDSVHADEAALVFDSSSSIEVSNNTFIGDINVFADLLKFVTSGSFTVSGNIFQQASNSCLRLTDVTYATIYGNNFSLAQSGSSCLVIPTSSVTQKVLITGNTFAAGNANAPTALIVINGPQTGPVYSLSPWCIIDNNIFQAIGGPPISAIYLSCGGVLIGPGNSFDSSGVGLLSIFLDTTAVNNWIYLTPGMIVSDTSTSSTNYYINSHLIDAGLVNVTGAAVSSGRATFDRRRGTATVTSANTDVAAPWVKSTSTILVTWAGTVTGTSQQMPTVLSITPGTGFRLFLIGITSATINWVVLS